MSKKGKALAAGAAIADGPSGLRRLLGVVVVLALLAGLGVAALLAMAWWVGRGDGQSTALGCPPESVAIAYSPADTPTEVREAVEEALRLAGREPAEGGYDTDQERDLVVSWWPTDLDPEAPRASGRGTVTLRLEEVPTAEEVTVALGDRLAPCEAAEPIEEPTKPAEPAQDAQDDSTAISWPWERGWSPVAGLGLAVVLWWVAGPNLVRWTWTAAWPLRLAWRRLRRRSYRRAVARGERVPAEWPERLPPGQWWENAEHLRDRRTYRQQIADDEAERLAELEALRDEGRVIEPRRLRDVLRDLIRRPASASAGGTDASTEGTPAKRGVTA